MKKFGKRISKGGIGKNIFDSYITPCTSDCYGLGVSAYFGTGRG